MTTSSKTSPGSPSPSWRKPEDEVVLANNQQRPPHPPQTDAGAFSYARHGGIALQRIKGKQAGKRRSENGQRIRSMWRMGLRSPCRTGRVGRTGRIGRIVRIDRIGCIGRTGRIGRIGRIGPIGHIRHILRLIRVSCMLFGISAMKKLRKTPRNKILRPAERDGVRNV